MFPVLSVIVFYLALGEDESFRKTS